ncbi:cytochrome c [Novosphingobium kunmingense]|uniref:Cytochrome c n=1 Tax=Novosphingobium kunmingense TaxID=1211806 RepID=A0A2N0H6H6_9SPHN|nr:cytochrome c [Novosphingobium kunmingense]PKB14551.1 cytochrome c [Novosphingobium kunmingense]
MPTYLRASLALVLMSCSNPDPAPPPPAFERASADETAHGERLARVLGCLGCHGADLAGRDWSDKLGTLWTANLTRSASTLGARDFARTVVEGQRPGGRELWDMPSYLFTQLQPDEVAAVTRFVSSRPVTGSVHPDPSHGPELKTKMAQGLYKSSAAEVREKGSLLAPPAAGHDLARHITRATCAECHGIDLRGKTSPIDGRTTPDIRPLAASYSAADFETLLTTGKAAGGRELTLMSEVARGRYKHLTQRERAAIHAYLSVLAEQP